MCQKKPGKYRNGRKNLIFATLVSIPGPLLLAISMAGGTSATQTADLMRRSCDLLSVFLAYLVFEVTTRYFLEDERKRARLETYVKYFTGFSMCFSGAVIDARLYFNYKTMQNAVLSVQARLHRAKMFLDCFMVVILSVWIMSPFDIVKSYADIIGSCSISIYLIWSGIRMILLLKQ